MRVFIAFIFIIFLFFSPIAFAQQNDSTKTMQSEYNADTSAAAEGGEIETVKPQRHEGSSGVKSFLTNEERMLTILFLGFGVLVLIMACVLLIKFSNDCNIAFKYFIIVLLILGMLVLIPVGYSNDQISPAVGLFGTIAGYLLGKTESSNKNTPPTP